MPLEPADQETAAENFYIRDWAGNRSVSVGLIAPKKGKTDSDVVGGLSYSVAAALTVGVEGGGNQNVGFGGLVFSLRPFVSGDAQYGKTLQAAHPKENQKPE